MRESLRKSGIDIIGKVPWGTHFCQFYKTKEDLMDTLVPYFKAGLKNNELCVWIISQPIEVEEAKEALKKAVPDIDVYLKKGQMEIIPYTHEYMKEGIFDPQRGINSWVEKIKEAPEKAYDGLRATGDASWLEKEVWDDFVDYEKKVDAIIDKNHVIALCSYYLDMCNAAEIIDIVSNHQFALIKREGKWERIENSGRRRAEKEAIQAAKNWKYTFDAVPDLIAILDNEYRIVRVNRPMAERLRMTPEECIGLTCYRVMHGTDGPPSSCPHQQLLKDELEHIAEVHEDGLGGYFMVSVSPLHDPEGKLTGCIHVARDITERKQEEYRIRRYNRVLEGINSIFSNVVQAKTEEEMGNACLSVALELTGSDFGFINKMGDDGLLHDVAKSELAWKPCIMYDKTVHRRPQGVFDVHCLYGRVINNEKSFFTNDLQSHPDSVGIPEGHPSITSFLCVPLVQNGKTMGLIAVANKEGGYSCKQQEDVEAIAPAIMQALQSKRAEEALKKAHENLEEKVKERTTQLEKAYNSLKESEEGLTESQRIAHIGNWDWDLVTGRVYWSNELYNIFGRSPEKSAPSYNELFNYIHPEDRESVEKSIKKGLKEEPKNGIDYRIILSNGEERTVHSQAEVIFDEQKIPVRVKGIVQDITELKKSEEKLQILANIIESSNDAIGTISLDGIVTSCNEEAEQVYGYSAEEILGKHISIFAPPHLEKETSELSEMIKQGKKIHHHETSRLRKDGKIIYVSITLSPVFDSHGKLTAISFISRDITERKKAEEKLRESEEKYRNIVETANEGIFIIDAESIVTYANKKMMNMLGYTLEEVIGRAIWDFVSEESKVIIKLNQERRKQGINESYELKLICKGGSSLWVLVSAKSLFDKNGRVTGSISMLTDITKRKEAEEALANIEIARKQEIHHRIKNNLQVISSLLDLQAEKFSSKEDINDSEVLEAFRESQDRVISMALIHEELYKGGGFDTLNFSSYIGELAENLFQTYSLGNANISLSMDLEENTFFDMDIAVPLGIIVNELVSNSLKHAFTKTEEGKIRIKLFREEKGNKMHKSLFSLTISDNGKGIPENIELENSESLGLQLVSTLVDQMDGEIELKRAHGTEFRITFKAAER